MAAFSRKPLRRRRTRRAIRTPLSEFRIGNGLFSWIQFGMDDWGNYLRYIVFGLNLICARLCYMKKEDLEKLKAQIQNDYEADMAAIKQLLSRHDDNRGARGDQLIALTAVNRVGGKIYDIVEDLVKHSHEKFTIYDILLKLQAQTGKAPTQDRGRIVSQVINKLRHRNPPEIEEIEKGRGSRSGIYQYKIK